VSFLRLSGDRRSASTLYVSNSRNIAGRCPVDISLSGCAFLRVAGERARSRTPLGTGCAEMCALGSRPLTIILGTGIAACYAGLDRAAHAGVG
jgi:hypothetical protein